MAEDKKDKLPEIKFGVYLEDVDKIEEMTEEEIGNIPPHYVAHVVNTRKEALELRDTLQRQAVLKRARRQRAMAKVERDRADFARRFPGLARKNQKRTEEAKIEAAESVKKAKAQKAAADAARGEGKGPVV